MKWLMLTVVLLLLMAGCPRPMNDEEVSKAADACQDKGMDAQFSGRFWTPRIVDVVCIPRKELIE